MKAATKKSTSVTLIVFGNIDGKQRAGTFAEADAELAKKAAAELGLSIREVNDKATRDLATKLRPGNAYANAAGFLPVAPNPVYRKLTIGAPGMVKGKDSEPHLPKSFQDIGVGSVVASRQHYPLRADRAEGAAIANEGKRPHALKERLKNDLRNEAADMRSRAHQGNVRTHDR